MTMDTRLKDACLRKAIRAVLYGALLGASPAFGLASTPTAPPAPAAKSAPVSAPAPVAAPTPAINPRTASR